MHKKQVYVANLLEHVRDQVSADVFSSSVKRYKNTIDSKKVTLQCET